jgi:hypothetical protein
MYVCMYKQTYRRYGVSFYECLSSVRVKKTLGKLFSVNIEILRLKKKGQTIDRPPPSHFFMLCNSNLFLTIRGRKFSEWKHEHFRHFEHRPFSIWICWRWAAIVIHLWMYLQTDDLFQSMWQKERSILPQCNLIIILIIIILVFSTRTEK